MQPETVVLRYVFRGRIWFAAPLLLVDEHEGLSALWLAPGTWRQSPQSPGRDRAIPTDWEVVARRWHEPGTLILVRPDVAHATWLFWRPDGALRSWYVNLQEPVRRTRFGFDSMDQALDLIARPDGTWEWKDEDELAEQVDRGVWTVDEAAAIRREGERVLAAWPFPTGWEDFRPDPAWPVPELPEGWHVI